LKINFITIVLLVAAIFSPLGSSASAIDSDLVGILTKNLGVTTKQAEGGSGAVFKEASKNMSVEDFTKITDALPEVTSLMKAAPSWDSSTVGGLSSALGKSGTSISSLAGLTSSFSKLGLSPEMVQKYIPIILDYAESKGGKTVANLLKSAIP
jgi:hypothetical protein